MLTMVSGFGYPLRFAPYFTNGNYEYLTMLVATKDAGQVPFNLDLSMNPHQKDVRVELDGWLDNDFPPPPNQGGGQSGGRRRFQRRPAGEGPSNMARRPPMERGNRGNTDIRRQREGRDNSSAGSNWIRPVNNWIDQLREKLIESGILTIDGSGECHLIGVQRPQSGAEILDANANKVVITPGNAKIMGNTDNHNFNEIIFENEGVLMLQNEANDFTNNQVGEGLMGGKSNVRIEEIVENDNTLDNVESNGLTSETQLDQENMPVTEDAPPGFPIPIYKETNDLGLKEKEVHIQNPPSKIKATPFSLAVRRSSRLEKKYSGGRVRYGPTRNKENKKKGKTALVNTEYQASLDPLNVEQAEMVIRMVGIQVKGNIEDEVAKVVMG